MFLASLLWALAGLAMIGAELFLPGFIIVFFGIGAVAVALLSLLPQIGGNPALQALLFAALSLGSLGLLRGRFAAAMKGSVFDTKRDRLDEISGERAVVSERIAPDAPGRARWRGTTWIAASYTETLEVGTSVVILGKEGMTLIVSSVGLEKPEEET